MKYSFEGSLGRISHQVSRDLGRHLERKFRQAGYSINNYEWAVLSYLFTHQKSCQKSIAAFLGTDKVMAKRIIDGLEKSGYVSRQEDTTDKRYKQVQMTPRGNALFKELEPFAGEVLETAFRGIPQSSISQTFDTLHRVLENLEEASPGTDGFNELK